MSLDPRFSIVTSIDPHNGRWRVKVTDYQTWREQTRHDFPTKAAAHAEGKQLVTAWTYGTSAVMAQGGAE